ncbi:DUF1294 domain-containing protein [Hydrogenophaga defluvii]|uniref:DUF1294 domain-containing protein n=1 Tax=Hydrogenophaga defluvii TaxID=249410 RepID=A0ABW2SEG2_9BURK
MRHASDGVRASHATAHIAGTLSTWHDDRGFGFITPAQGGQEIFVHIKAFPPGTGRPQVGQALNFRVEMGPNGKKRAVGVQFATHARAVPKGRARVEAPARWTWPRLLAIPAFGLLAAYVFWRWGLQPRVLLVYGGLSVLSFFAYVFDKAAAERGRWRTAEQTLHLLDVAGGWPGGLVAQQLMRHKTAKPAFVALFWATVLLNMAGFVVWHAGGLDGLLG